MIKMRLGRPRAFHTFITFPFSIITSFAKRRAGDRDCLRNDPSAIAAQVFYEGIMSVDARTVRRIAHLARIAVADDEVEDLKAELNAILAFVEQLSEVNIEGIEPMTSVTPMAMKKREDRVTDGEIPDLVVKNAPARQDHFFVVPKVVE
jgi:aspartyl-tRNA(Asn)/glutamyl-tRNA(Gln) amidotransferase subunit C